MRAIVFDQPGDESVLHLGEVPAPTGVWYHPRDPIGRIILLAHGAERVSVVALEHVFDAKNPLYDALERRIGAAALQLSDERAG